MWPGGFSVGGGLTLFHAVGLGSDLLWLCRPPPSEEPWRDLIARGRLPARARPSSRPRARETTEKSPDLCSASTLGPVSAVRVAPDRARRLCFGRVVSGRIVP